MTREATVVIADTHTHSKLALAKPGIYLDDGDPYQLNTIQRWMLPVWEECLDDIATLTKGYYRNIILNGDLIDVDSKDRTWQLISRNPTDAVKHAEDLLEPLVQTADTLFVLRGTEAHTGKAAHHEEQLAHNLEAEKCPKTKQSSWWHLRAIFGGVSFDIAHHYSMGRLPWTYPNSANKLAFETMYHYHDWGETPPDVVIRAHNHRFADSGRNYKTRAVFCPCWQYHTSYLHRIGKPNDRPHIGALVFLCENGEITRFENLMYRPVRSKPWQRKSLLASILPKKN